MLVKTSIVGLGFGFVELFEFVEVTLGSELGDVWRVHRTARALHCTALHCTVLSGRCPRRRSPRRGSSQRSSRRSVAQAFENPLSYLIGKPFEFEFESGVNKVGVEIEVEIEIEVEVGLMLSTIGEHRSYMLGHWIWQRGWC